MVASSLNAVLNALAPDGRPRDITKVEIEILDDGRCRWNLFDGHQRIFTALARPADQPRMLDTTRTIVDTMTAARRAEAEARHERED